MQEHQSAGFRKGVGWGSSGCWGGKRPRGEDPKFLHRQGKGEVGGLAGGEPGKQLGRRIGMGDGSARRLANESAKCILAHNLWSRSAPCALYTVHPSGRGFEIFVVVIVVVCVFVVFVVSCLYCRPTL